MPNPTLEGDMTEGPLVALPTRDRDAVLSYVILAGALALFGSLAMHMASYLPDDPFISYRYAENLGTGYGLTFNANEPPVEGYSNFLWILIAALVRRLGLSIAFWMPRVGVLVGMLIVVFLWLMYRQRRVRPSRMILPLALLCTSGPLMLYVVSGFETPLFALLLVMLLVTLDKARRSNAIRHWLALTGVGVLLFLTRPEGIVAFPAVVGLMLLLSWKASNETPMRQLRPALLVSLLFLISFGVYTYWRLQYFHELLPTPFLSKGGDGTSVTTAWSMNREMYFERQGFDENAVAPFGYYYVALVLVAIAGLFSSRSQRPEKHTEVTALMLGVLYSLVYVNFVDWYPAMRYHSGLTPLFFLPGVWLGNAAVDWTPPRKHAPRIAGFVTVGMALLSINYGIFKEVRMEAVKSTVFHDRLLSVAEWLKQSASADALLATPDVGMVPYYSGLPTLDIHPNALVDLHIAKEGFSPNYFFARDPTFVLVTSRHGRVFRESEQQVMSDPRFTEGYRLMGIIRLDWFEDVSYRVYVKNGVTISDEQAAGFPKGIPGPA